MSYEPHLIAPFKSGLSNYYKPFLIGNDAFVNLVNAYTWRGTVKKREGSIVLARITKQGAATAITNASPPQVTLNAHGLLTGDMVYLENVVATNGTIVSISAGSPTVITTTGNTVLSNLNTVYLTGIPGNIGTKLNNNTFTIISVVTTSITINVDTTGLTGGGGGTVELGDLEKKTFYVTKVDANNFTLQYLNVLPAGSSNVLAPGQGASADVYLPIVGTRTFIVSSTGNEQLIAFTPKKSWLFNTTTQVFNDVSFNSLGAPITWAGTKDNFFYTSNFATVMWTTNNVFNIAAQPVGIRFFNGSTTAGWQDYEPLLNTVYLNSALIILPYKGRLVALNVTEGTNAAGGSQTNTTYQNRARWDQLGTPFAGTQGAFAISNITIGASPNTVTANGHTFVNGNTVGIANVVGTVGQVVNGNSYVIAGVAANTFQISVDTSGKVYTSGGIAQLMTTPPTGFNNDINAWRDDIPGKGGFIDADTSEQIVACGIIQDTLIVGFQFSMWRLRYTGNEILPFIWERINTQYGIEGTFTSVEFDEGLLGISRRGITKTSFNDTERIDLQVPDFVDDFESGTTTEGINRIQGIRDYQKRLVYWIYGDEANNAQTPNNILCFNYQDKTWAQFSQSFTCLGQYKQTVDNIWSTWTSIWEGDTTRWDTPLDQQGAIMIVAGDVTSRVWQIMAPDVSTDNSINFNFIITTNLINPYFEQAKRCRLQYYDLYATSTDVGQCTVQNFIDDNPDTSWLNRTVSLVDSQSETHYTRVFLGLIARQHQITITLSPTQLADANIGASDFELQGIVFHTRDAGRIKR